MKESTTYQAILCEGRQEGRQEGIQEGVLRSKQEDVLEVLRERFGVISPEVEQQIRLKTDPEELRQLLRAATRVAKPEDLQP